MRRGRVLFVAAAVAAVAVAGVTLAAAQPHSRIPSVLSKQAGTLTLTQTTPSTGEDAPGSHSAAVPPVASLEAGAIASGFDDIVAETTQPPVAGPQATELDDLRELAMALATPGSEAALAASLSNVYSASLSVDGHFIYVAVATPDDVPQRARPQGDGSYVMTVTGVKVVVFVGSEYVATE